MVVSEQFHPEHQQNKKDGDGLQEAERGHCPTADKWILHEESLHF